MGRGQGGDPKKKRVAEMKPVVLRSRGGFRGHERTDRWEGDSVKKKRNSLKEHGHCSGNSNFIGKTLSQHSLIGCAAQSREGLELGGQRTTAEKKGGCQRRSSLAHKKGSGNAEKKTEFEIGGGTLIQHTTYPNDRAPGMTIFLQPAQGEKVRRKRRFAKKTAR